jgi:glutamate synthase (NADPH/NADH) small chain
VLAQKGYDVTIFEVLHAAGGVLMYGIPQFRLPKEIVQHEIDGLKQMGVHVQTNAIIGRTFTIDELMKEEGFNAVYIATGAGLPHFMHIEGEELNGVYAANEFLTRVNLMKAYTFPKAATPVYIGKKVAVVGGGNVAMDAARTAMRLGAEHVYIVYRRGEDELPARKEEVGHAKEEGIEFYLLNNPVRVVGDDKGWVTGLECVKMELGEADASGRRSPVAVKDSNHVLEVDEVVMAIGQGPNPLISQTTPDLAVNKRGNIVADENGATSMPGVYAGGDIVTGAATVISAMGAGKKAAAAIDEYLMK